MRRIFPQGLKKAVAHVPAAGFRPLPAYLCKRVYISVKHLKWYSMRLAPALHEFLVALCLFPAQAVVYMRGYDGKVPIFP